MSARRVQAYERLPAASAYEVLLWLAAGGMGTVFVGRRKRSHVGRLYALKRTHEHLLTDRACVSSIVHEGWLASRIQHPNVVAVHDIEETDNECVLVMDYVDGVAAQSLMRRRTGPGSAARAVVRILLDVAAGLQAAHDLRDENGKSLQVVHRDVSPQNILVGADGLARIADFGVAKAAKQLMTRTQTGMLRGKVAYMAPEYVSTGQLDPRSDVFALGLVAWELLCARRMFEVEDDLELLRVFASEKRVAPSTIAAPLAWADESILTAVAADPDRRFPSASAFAEALRDAAKAARTLGEQADVAQLVHEVDASALQQRQRLLREILRDAGDVPRAPPTEHTASLPAAELDAALAPTVAVTPTPVPSPAPLPVPVREYTASPMPVRPSAPTPRPRPPNMPSRGTLAIGIATALLLAGAFVLSRPEPAPERSPGVFPAPPPLPIGTAPPAAGDPSTPPTPVPVTHHGPRWPGRHPASRPPPPPTPTTTSPPSPPPPPRSSGSNILPNPYAPQ